MTTDKPKTKDPRPKTQDQRPKTQDPRPNTKPMSSHGKELKSRPKRFFAWSVLNRDLCQLECFRRVLEEALDKSTPVREKLKFLSVFSSNLDELFMVRVSGLKEMLDIDDLGPMPGELTPDEQLDVIRKRVLTLVDEHTNCLREEVIPELQSHRVVIARYASLSQAEKRSLAEYFRKNIFLVLTPQAV